MPHGDDVLDVEKISCRRDPEPANLGVTDVAEELELEPGIGGEGEDRRTFPTDW